MVHGMTHSMQITHFDKAVEKICDTHPRIDKAAYYFLQDALNHASEKAQESGATNKHVSAEELLLGFKDFALQQFGPMASTLFAEWNLQQCSDIGDMVFNLIDEGIFSKQESDKREDFHNIYDFKEAFVVPFLPSSKAEKVILKKN